jgi:hypothetical protein
VEPTKENALNLPEVVVDEGVFVPLSPTEAAEGEGFMPLSPAEDAEVFFSVEVMPAVSPCQSSLSTVEKSREEGCDMMESVLAKKEQCSSVKAMDYIVDKGEETEPETGGEHCNRPPTEYTVRGGTTRVLQRPGEQRRVL